MLYDVINKAELNSLVKRLGRALCQIHKSLGLLLVSDGIRRALQICQSRAPNAYSRLVIALLFFCVLALGMLFKPLKKPLKSESENIFIIGRGMPNIEKARISAATDVIKHVLARALGNGIHSPCLAPVHKLSGYLTVIGYIIKKFVFVTPLNRNVREQLIQN